MGKYMRKCKAVGEVAVMDVSPVGVRTRARTLALATATATATAATSKKKKPVSSSSSSSANSRAHRRSTKPTPVSRRNSSNSARDQVDRCSSDGSTHLNLKHHLNFADPEGLEYLEFTHSRETTPSSTNNIRSESDDLESTTRLFTANSCWKPAVVKMPLEEEIEAFFSVAEKKEQKRFIEKYNYDVVDDVPLNGPYEWVRLK